MKKAIPILLLVSFTLGLLIYLASFFQIELPRIIRFYVNDFLITPIVLSISLLVIRKIRNDQNYTLSFFVVIYLCSFYAIIFEYFLPQYMSRYTADIVDVFLYFLGGIVFYCTQKLN